MSSRTHKKILLVSGSSRATSVNTAVLVAAKMALPEYWHPKLYSDITLLPQFDPDAESRGVPPSVSRLRDDIDNASALLFSTPEYAGTMPAALKGLLEWTIGSTVMTDKAVGWINPSTAPQRAAGAYSSLEAVLGYTRAWIVPSACKDVSVLRTQISSSGTIDDKDTLNQIGLAVRELIDWVELSGPSGNPDISAQKPRLIYGARRRQE